MATTENTYTGDGSTVLYSFTFPYIDETDVYVSLGGTVTTAYSYANATTIQFNTAPASGVAIRIFRATSSTDTKAAFFAGSAIRSKDLNDNFTQALYIAQESENVADAAKTQAAAAEASAATANTNATAAAASAATATTQATASAASAATASAQATQASTDAAAAQASATAAQTSATAAAADAAQAATDSASAISTANAASALATTADGNATTALNNSRQSNGQGGFDTAISIANTASTTATTSAASAASAVTTANSAAATANAASAAVSAAAFYTPIAALANLPSSPSNEDRVEVINSTGVQSSSAVSGVPTGFVGSTDLTVRLQYNSSTSKWVWQQYFAADPENRYATNYLAVIKGDGTSSGQVGKITLNCSNNNHGVSIQSPAHSAGATYTLTLPVNTGSANQALTTDGSGVLSWADAGSPTIDGGNFTTGGSLVTTTQTIDGGSF